MLAYRNETWSSFYPRQVIGSGARLRSPPRSGTPAPDRGTPHRTECISLSSTGCRSSCPFPNPPSRSRIDGVPTVPRAGIRAETQPRTFNAGAALGIPAFACTPDKFPTLLAVALDRGDVQSWANANAAHH